MNRLLLIAISALLAACQSREPISICAAYGDPSDAVTAVMHQADGTQSVLSYEAATGLSLIEHEVLATPLLPALWRMAETTMRSLPEVESVPCGLDVGSAVTVIFDDGTVTTRQTSCTGNALSRVRSEAFSDSGISRGAGALEDQGDGQALGALENLAAACERLQ